MQMEFKCTKEEIKKLIETIFEDRKNFSYDYASLKSQIKTIGQEKGLISIPYNILETNLSKKSLSMIDEILWELIFERKIIMEFSELFNSNLKFRKLT